MRTLDALLGEHAFFGGLERATLELIAGCGSNVRFAPEEYIAREGEPADRFYLLRHGRASVEVFAPNRGAVTIQTIREGDILGWSWLFAPYRWQFDVRAAELVRAVAFDGNCLRGKCEADAQVGYQLIKRFSEVMVRRLQATRLQLLDVYGHARGT